MTTTTERLLRSFLLATAFVALLSVLSILPHLDFFAYALFPGIDLAGLIFSNGIESLHLLRFEVASFLFNIVVYTGIFYFLLTPSRTRKRRTVSEYRGGSRTTASSNDPQDTPALLPESPVAARRPLSETAEDE
jgi:hypothetical protein